MTITSGEQGQEPGAQQVGGQGQEPGAGAGQGQEPGQQGTESGQQTGGPEGIDLSTIQDPAVRAYLERVQNDAREARQEAARYRTERNTLTQQVTEFQRQNETAEQAAERERQEREQAASAERERLQRLEQENRDLRVGGAVREAAREARAHNPQVVESMIRAQVTLDEEGKPTNVEALIQGLRESDPYLFRRTSRGGGDGTGGGAAGVEPSDMNAIIRSARQARLGQGT